VPLDLKIRSARLWNAAGHAGEERKRAAMIAARHCIDTLV
jgi:hypothetical protein